MAKALIVVDVQVDFCEGGALGVDGGNAVAEKTAELLNGDHGYSRVVATRDHHIDPGEQTLVHSMADHWHLPRPVWRHRARPLTTPHRQRLATVALAG